jgi:hypothetical protein
MNALSPDYQNHPGHADYDPTKDIDFVPLTSKDQAAADREKALRKISQAQALLYEAAQLTCPLQGFLKPWEAIGDHADATKALWHRVNNAPRPTGHDEFCS